METLIACSEDEIPFVRTHAAIALSEIGSPKGLEAVEWLAASDPVERVKKIAGKALRALRDQIAP